MCINSVKETCVFSEVSTVGLSGFGNKLFNYRLLQDYHWIVHYVGDDGAV